MNPARRKLRFYWALVALYVVVSAWWAVYFTRMPGILTRRMQSEGAALDAKQLEALKDAIGGMSRMFLFEGGFLGLLLLASAYLVVRALVQEVAVHRQQRNFLSAVTHELKSPIASASLYVETLRLGRAVDDEQRERYLDHAKQDLDRLRDMVDHLLESARFASTGPEVQVEDVDLADVTRSVVERLREEHSEGGLTIELDTPDQLPARADTRAIDTILRNLVSNSIKYGGEQATIQISLQARAGRAVLEVRDDGPGLRGADKRQIMGAFVRGGDENVRTQKGVGLGLFMVAELCRAMQGSARVIDAESGFAIEVSLPGTPPGAVFAATAGALGGG